MYIEAITGVKELYARKTDPTWVRKSYFMKRYAKAKADGRCVDCAKRKAEKGKTRCKRCAEFQSLRAKRKRKRGLDK